VKWLADACVDARLVAALNAAGCSIRQVKLGEDPRADEDILEVAWTEGRLVLSDDKDFGQWVIRKRRRVPGLVLVRIEPTLIELKITRVVDLYRRLGQSLRGKLLVVGPRFHRLRDLEQSE
jgi:predicted nuclease of predicted toxin-antitoxin system